MIRGGIRYLFGRHGQRRVHGLRMFYRLRALALLTTDEKIIRPLTRSTEVRLWVDGPEAFPRIEKLLARARHTIIIQMFIWKDDATGRRIAQILIEAADRGVHVDITKESVGDVFELQNDFLTTKGSSDPVWSRFWSHPRIRIHHATHHDHAKVFVIDDQTLLLTGMNIGDEYSGDWHDYLVELRGRRFVEQFLTGVRPQGRVQDRVRLLINSSDRKELRTAVRDLLQSARSSIVLEQCYFSDAEVIRLLIDASHRGVRVTVIVPETPDIHYHANLQAIARLIVEGSPHAVQVFLYQHIVHGKVILVDLHRAFIGSANMVQSSLDRMGEVNVLIEGEYRTAIRKLRRVLREDILKSKPLTWAPRLWWIGRWLASLGL